MIPEAFLDRMRLLLGTAEYEAFCNSLTSEQSVHAVRCNSEKMDTETLLSVLGEQLSPISYTSDGFFCALPKIGHHPLHHAGAVYSQDPGAMAPVNCIDVQKGWRVLDLCAAPGGKSTHLAALIGQDGVLLSNEISLPRCKVLAGNVERLGLKNTFVSNLPTEQIAAWFSSWFDLVVVDAPCSGEGMFRKYDYAGEEWSPESVLSCADRQAEILANAARTVKGGGYLLYSTCTFSLEENEMTVDAFLEAHPDFSICEVKDAVKRVTADGIAFDGAKHPGELRRARRFYPHLHAGEGQFMCLLQRREDADALSEIRYKEPKDVSLSRDELALATAFLRDTLEEPIGKLLPGYILKKQGDMICLVSKDFPLLPHHGYLSGVAVGTVTKGRIEPHHHYFSAMGSHFRRKLALAPDGKELASYLRGETVATDLSNGYAAVTVAGAALGGVKVVNGIAKNHYPKGLRNP